MHIACFRRGRAPRQLSAMASAMAPAPQDVALPVTHLAWGEVDISTACAVASMARRRKRGDERPSRPVSGNFSMAMTLSSADVTAMRPNGGRRLRDIGYLPVS